MYEHDLLNQRAFLRSLILWFLVLSSCAPLHVTPSTSSGNTEAIVILPGIGMKRDTPKHVKKKFAVSADGEGYDVLLGDFQSRRSIDHGVEELHGFLNQQDLDSYDRVHVFAYILGGYTFNRYHRKYPIKNLGNVVYDRSPLQEVAPKLASTGWLALPVRVWHGPLVADLAATPYSPIPLPGSKVGLIVENRATAFIRKRRDRALELVAPLSFDPSLLKQEHDDVIHVPFDHDEMYSSFDQIGPELLHFFKRGTFSPGAAREPLGIDPFTNQ